MKSLVSLGAILLTATLPAIAAPESRPTLPIPRIVGGADLKQLIRGSSVWELRERGFDDQMSEMFRRDGSYSENDGANEGDVGRYYFSGNSFCIKYADRRKPDRCRSVLIDSRKRTWLISEGDGLNARLVSIINH